MTAVRSLLCWETSLSRGCLQPADAPFHPPVSLCPINPCLVALQLVFLRLFYPLPFTQGQHFPLSISTGSLQGPVLFTTGLLFAGEELAQFICQAFNSSNVDHNQRGLQRKAFRAASRRAMLWELALYGKIALKPQLPQQAQTQQLQLQK